MFEKLTKIPQKDVRWSKYPLLSEVPVYDLAQVREVILSDSLSYIGAGAHHMVFRSNSSEDITLKFIQPNCELVEEVIQDFFRNKNTELTRERVHSLKKIDQHN